MASPSSHVTRCLLAGLVALLPIGGAAVSIVWLEATLSGSWLREQPFYVPGLGLLLALLAVYLVGLCVTTFVGRFLWRRMDRLLERLPLLGELYQSLKEVLGYDTSRDRFFRGVVLVEADGGHEVGLVTGETTVAGGAVRATVFVPGSPNPGNGRLLLVPKERLVPIDVRAADALRALVSLGKAPLGAPER